MMRITMKIKMKKKVRKKTKKKVKKKVNAAKKAIVEKEKGKKILFQKRKKIILH